MIGFVGHSRTENASAFFLGLEQVLVQMEAQPLGAGSTPRCSVLYIPWSPGIPLTPKAPCPVGPWNSILHRMGHPWGITPWMGHHQHCRQVGADLPDKKQAQG